MNQKFRSSPKDEIWHKGRAASMKEIRNARLAQSQSADMVERYARSASMQTIQLSKVAFEQTAESLLTANTTHIQSPKIWGPMNSRVESNLDAPSTFNY